MVSWFSLDEENQATGSGTEIEVRQDVDVHPVPRRFGYQIDRGRGDKVSVSLESEIFGLAKASSASSRKRIEEKWIGLREKRQTDRRNNRRRGMNWPRIAGKKFPEGCTEKGRQKEKGGTRLKQRVRERSLG